jgi:hypothetical protein
LNLENACSIGAVGGQRPELGPAGFNCGFLRRALMRTQIVHNDDIAGMERRDEFLLDVGGEL